MYIQDVTMNTGHNKPYNRFECRPETIKVCQSLLKRALSEQAPVSIPVDEWSHLQFACFPDGRKLVITVYGPAGPHIPGKPYSGHVMPLLTSGIAQHSKDAPLWEALEGVYQKTYSAPPKASRPQAPWMGTVVYPTAEVYKNSLALLADFTRCMAWAWIELDKTN